MKLPELQSREEMLRLLAENEYGITPDAPRTLWAKQIKRENDALAGKATIERLKVHFEADFGAFEFPFDLTLPVCTQPVPAFVYIDFHREQPNKYLPLEEIIDHGFAVAHLYYQDIVNDNLNGDFSTGLGKVYYDGRAREPHEWGKIGMWAYAASRVMDVLEGMPEIDKTRVAVIGHSRLGKTALWCGAQDTRFCCVISNDSGCGGAAILRNKTGEHLRDMERSGMWDWLCDRCRDYRFSEEELPLDQHYLLACVAPRLLAVGSASLDSWADPDSEYKACVHAQPMWEGSEPLPEKTPEPGAQVSNGFIQYHHRPGTHFLSRYDWLRYMRFMEEKA